MVMRTMMQLMLSRADKPSFRSPKRQINMRVPQVCKRNIEQEAKGINS
jgi:hypothetical protein